MQRLVDRKVITGFGAGDDLAVLGAAEALLAGRDATAAVAGWRAAVAG